MVQHCWTIEEIKENNDLGLIAGKGFHSNEGLPRKTSAFLIFLQWPIYLIILVDKTKYSGFLYVALIAYYYLPQTSTRAK